MWTSVFDLKIAFPVVRLNIVKTYFFVSDFTENTLATDMRLMMNNTRYIF